MVALGVHQPLGKLPTAFWIAVWSLLPLPCDVQLLVFTVALYVAMGLSWLVSETRV